MERPETREEFIAFASAVILAGGWVDRSLTSQDQAVEESIALAKSLEKFQVAPWKDPMK